MLRLKLFGAAIVERDGQPLDGAARQRRVIALLALVAAARSRGISRDRLLALLWPESDSERARQSLTQGLYHARRALGCDELFLAAADVRLNPDVITVDVWDFENALTEGRLDDAVAAHAAPLLDGFFLNAAPEFERWLADERSRLTSLLGNALESLATAAEGRGESDAATGWRRRRAALDPLNSRFAIDLLLTLERSGDRAAALQHAKLHEALLREELDLPLPLEVSELVERLRREPLVPGAASRSAPTSTSRAAVLPEPDFAPTGVAAPTGVGGDAAATSASSRWKRKRWRYGILAAAAVVVASSVALLVPRAAPKVPVDTLMVAPFRVSGAETALSFLREGLVDLLATKLGEDSTTRTIDAGTVLSAWHQTGVGSDTRTSLGEALVLGKRLGASRLLLGSVVGTPRHLVLNASLLSVTDTSLLTQASVEGPSDSLTTLVDRLVARLIATQSGTADRLADQTTTSSKALRAYLKGRAQYRLGRYRESVQQFRTALGADPLFALAGMGLAQAGDRLESREDVARGLSAAWAARANLAEKERVYLEAFAGPRYPAPSSGRERLDAWERAAAAAPDRAGVWHELGKTLFHDGRLLGVADWRQRANAAFNRAIELDSGFASPLQYQLQLAAAQHDSAAVRRIAAAYLRIDSLGDMAAFVRWRSSIVLGDSASLRQLRKSFASLPSASLRTIALSSVSNGVALDDAQRALSILRNRAARASERGEILLTEHALALDRGKLSVATTVLKSLEGLSVALGFADRLTVLDAMYGPIGIAGADSAAARMTARVETLLASQDAAPEVDSTMRAALREDLCSVGQWHAWRGDSAQASRMANRLGTDDEMSSLCAVLIRTIVAIDARAPEGSTLLARYDSALTSTAVDESMREYGFLALTRLYAEHGDDRRALQVARRRAHLAEWPRYLASQLREEGLLSVAALDTAGAIQAFRHYLALRGDADEPVKPEVAEVRSELKQLGSEKK